MKVEVELHKVSFSYGEGWVFKEISLRLTGGVFYALLGPNGSGKSTLLSLISGLLVPQEGEVILCGKKMRKISLREVARHVALVPQDFFVRFPYTVYYTVLTGRFPFSSGRWAYSEEDHRLTKHYLDEGGILHLADSPVTALSGGESQKVAFVRALVRETPVLLLDEPVSNIDVASTLNFLKKARLLAQGGKLVVAAFHDLNLASLFADQIIFVKGGQVELWEDKREALSPQNIQRIFGIEVVPYESPEGELYLLYRVE
ncbi:ABC transporter ATP-binding protein [Thermatribacter velox]|uniref:ABC transporter ATP-binding protein n=1 Tax=Thermatribacter velox TaxID=3039681 RepID=A0ABZ2YAW7_9BACT